MWQCKWHHLVAKFHKQDYGVDWTMQSNVQMFLDNLAVAVLFGGNQ